MTWSLKLRHGELERTTNQLSKVTNEEKMVQDLRIQFLHQMGIDPLHPDFGSLLDGGVTSDGRVHETLIGTDDKEKAMLLIQSEIYRIVNDYQQRQLVRARRDKMTYGKATLTPREVLLNINNINVIENTDSLQVIIEISNATRETQVLNLSVNT